MTNSPINTHQNNIDHLNEVSFDDIRPLKDGEVKAAIESLLTDEMFKRAVTPIIAPISWEMFSKQLRSYNTVFDFQENVIYASGISSSSGGSTMTTGSSEGEAEASCEDSVSVGVPGATGVSTGVTGSAGAGARTTTLLRTL